MAILKHTQVAKRARGRRLGQMVIARGTISENSSRRISGAPIDPSAVQLVKESFARYHQLLPIGIQDAKLLWPWPTRRRIG